ncbi:MAG TPA: TetR/AcrR family transcriptional regulator [Terriglobales bacterium]|nr:TetR/AcrR family transcriptional regulator [Terriglobales bacterium]
MNMSLEGKTRRQALTEFREAEILGAARKVFGEHGFAAATIEMIAAAAGVAKGTLYLYYSSKEEIFWNALSSRFREMIACGKQEVDRAEGTEAKIRASLRVRFEFFRSDEAFMRMYLTEFGQFCGPGGLHRLPVRELYIESAAYLAEVLAEGMRKGELRPGDPLEAAMALMELTKAVFAMRFSGLAGQNPEFDGERFVFNLFWNGVKA